MKKNGIFVLPVLLLGVGLLLVILVGVLIPAPELAIVVTLATFLLFNFVTARLLDLSPSIKKKWSLLKLWHFLPGFILGSVPIGFALIDLSFSGDNLLFKPLSLISVILTLATVSWEEAWFRGVPLELAAKIYSRLGAAILFGAIFSLLHVMNPKVDLFRDGLQIWLAGYTLSLCYFVFNSIWAAIGMHFANNLIQALFGMSVEPALWSYYLPLLTIAIAFSVLVIRQSQSTGNTRDINT